MDQDPFQDESQVPIALQDESQVASSDEEIAGVDGPNDSPPTPIDVASYGSDSLSEYGSFETETDEDNVSEAEEAPAKQRKIEKR